MDPNTNPTPTPNPAPNPAPTPNPVAPTMPNSQPPIPEPAEAPVYQPSQPIAAPTIEATDPITMPDPLPEPDPVEEALKQPIKPADPVPGSIGSAVSMPPVSATPDMAPVAEPTMPTNPMMTAPAPAKKSSKATIILLAILAAVIILGLGAFLVIQLVGQTPSNPVPPETPTEEDEEPTPVLSTLTCKRTLEEVELAGIGNAIKGAENLFADYEDGILTTIERGWSLEFADTAAADTALAQLKVNYEDTFAALELDTDPFDSKYDNQEGVVEINHIAAAEDLDDANMSIFELTADEEDKIATDSKSITAAYETLGFTCNEE